MLPFYRFIALWGEESSKLSDVPIERIPYTHLLKK